MSERIVQLRTERGLTQGKLARRAGVSTTYVQRIEAGDYQRPSLVYLSKLADALEVSIEELTGVDTERADDPRYTPQQQAMLEAVPPKATAAFADFTRGLFSMPEDEWRAFISYNVTHFARIKGLQITERAESKDVTVLGNDPPASEEQEQDLQEG